VEGSADGVNPEDRYASEVGLGALERQKTEAESGRCSYCWAPPGEPHTTLCPNRPEDEEPAVPSQDEALF
jgi:hypothetical protein